MFRNKWILTGLSALLFNLSFLVPSLSFLIWIAFIPLFQLIELCHSRESGNPKPGSPIKAFGDDSRVQIAFFSSLVGLAFFLGLFYWIHKYELRILILVLCFAAPYFVFFALLVSLLQKKINSVTIHIFIPGLAWSFVNLLYALTPVESLGDLISFYEAARFPGLVRTIGTSGITFLILLTNSFIFDAFKTKKLVSIIGLLMVIFLLSFGSSPIQNVILSGAKDPERDSSAFGLRMTAGMTKLRVALIQHNFLIEPVWRNENKQKIMNHYEETIRSLSGNVDLIIFPQYGLPVDVLRAPEVFQNLINSGETSVLLGTYLPKIKGGSLDSGERTDSALLFTPNQPVQEYQAVTPPPFRQIGQVTGSERRPLLLTPSPLSSPTSRGRGKGEGEIPIGIMLCYEDVRPEESKIWVQNGAQLLVSLSNTGHFLNTHLPDYHFAQDRLRAMETGRYLVRVSPNGFSGIVDPNGKALLKSQLGTAEILKGSIDPIKQQTVFGKLPISIHAILAGIFLIVLLTTYARDSMKRLALKMR